MQIHDGMAYGFLFTPIYWGTCRLSLGDVARICSCRFYVPGTLPLTRLDLTMAEGRTFLRTNFGLDLGVSTRGV